MLAKAGMENQDNANVVEFCFVMCVFFMAP